MALVSTARVDLVCEGGGVRGIGLVGAVDALADAGYRFPRVAGSSAGAIVASLVAALQTAGEPVTRLAEMMRSIDYPKFLDRNLIGHVPLIGGGLSLLLSDGVYRGAYLEPSIGWRRWPAGKSTGTSIFREPMRRVAAMTGREAP